MIIEIQGHSDDIVEVLNDTTGDEEYDIGANGMVVIRIGDPMKLVFLITVQYSDLHRWVFLLGIEGYESRCAPRGTLPGRLDVELSKDGDGPRWVIDVPDDTDVAVHQVERNHTLARL